ncbi:VWA domain-containing protein [soil metagenome]
MKKITLILFSIIAIAGFRSQRNTTITGTVSDLAGNPLAGVFVLAGKEGTTTDTQGYYSITVSDKEKYLIFQTVGFESKKIKINGQIRIDAKLKPVEQKLEEVVETGYDSNVALRGIVSGIKIKGYSPGASNSMMTKRSNPSPVGDFNTEEYSNIFENGFHKVSDDPLSTFSIDVDAASYSNVRRFLNSNQLPPAGAVRTEEMINYFKYDYPQPAGNVPFSINTELSDCPWNKQNKLLLIGLQGKNIPVENLPPSNLVFLIDVSGSMSDENKLPLVKASMKLLADQLREQDHISIVVYAGSAGLVLPVTSGGDKQKIKRAIENLEAGGSTAGGAGIQLAYKTARENFLEKGNNRVILCTDGDFNIGASSDDEMVRLIEKEREKSVFLTVLGYGMGNYKDSKMQQLADKGNGNHAYIDGMSEAKKVLVNEFGGTLFTIAKDVKLQLEFNPAKVAGYRLIGYENRLLNKEDFNDDKKDAGELGSGHTVTALYEIIPAGIKSEYLKNVDPLKYQKKKNENLSLFADELLTIKFRYKAPAGSKSELIVHPVKDEGVTIENTTDNFRFAAAVADFSMLLRNSEYKGTSNLQDVISLAMASSGNDTEGYRKEFVELVKKASKLSEHAAIKLDADQ